MKVFQMSKIQAQHDTHANYTSRIEIWYLKDGADIQDGVQGIQKVFYISPTNWHG